MVILTPVLGVWLASSLASYLNGPRWLTIIAGALLFPVLPVAWDMWSEHRRNKKGKTVRFLKGGDRIILRTLCINAVFIVSLLLINPSSAFTALSARGDWMLDGHTGVTANNMRVKLYFLADRLEWLYELTHDNPFEIEPELEPEDGSQTEDGLKSDDSRGGNVKPAVAKNKNRSVSAPAPSQNGSLKEGAQSENAEPFVWPLTA